MLVIAARPVRIAQRAPAFAWLPAAATLAFAVWQQAFATPLDADVSWLLTVGERVLDGARLYRDVFEVNPPASVLLYLPGIAAARILGVSPEAMTVALAFAIGLASAWIAARIVGERSPAIAALAGFALFVLPGGCFAQREHFALLFALPALAAIARAAEGDDAPWWTGLGAGLTVALKPHFALALLLPALLAWRRRGSLQPLTGGLAASAIVVAAYALTVLLAFPTYLTEAVPLLRAVYLPLHEQWPRLLLGPVVSLPLVLGALALWLAPPLLAAGARAAVVSRTRPVPPYATQAIVCLLAMTGFALAGLIQAKGYPNHALPAAVLGLLAVAFAARTADAHKRRLALAGAAVLALLQWHAFARIGPRPGLAEAIARVAPPHPRIAALGIDLDLGHPATRAVGGTWVGRRAAQYAWGGVQWRGDPALGHYASEDVAIWVQDIACGRPDVILVDEAPGSANLRRDPAIRRALAAYRPAARAGDASIWTRVTPPSPARNPAFRE